jgi:MoxR-like ATPase
LNAPLSLDEVRTAQDRLSALRDQVNRVYIGEPIATDMLLVGLLSQGHVLLEGVPGVAKTTLVKTFAEALGLGMRRVQFTPDLLPQDITGTYVLDPKTGTFKLRTGPIFAHVVLADEINRAPAKTQSALLEAMQESQVTIEGDRLALPNPFLVLATQNPVDLEGTFPLPEAQVDRFLVQVELGYPSQKDELQMLRTHGVTSPPVQPVMDVNACLRLQQLTQRVHVEDDVLEYATLLTRFTRNHPQVVLGCSPRATLSLVRASKAHAVLSGRPYATPDDVRAVAQAVLAHRLVVVPELEGTATARKGIIQEALAKVSYRKQVRAV